jgi:hypothetical protein
VPRSGVRTFPLVCDDNQRMLSDHLTAAVVIARVATRRLWHGRSNAAAPNTPHTASSRGDQTVLVASSCIFRGGRTGGMARVGMVTQIVAHL